MSIPITVTIITKNAATTLERCLNSVAWVDEIIIVDSGSTDTTLEIAKRLAQRVEYHTWTGYGPQKRYAASLAKNDWILSIDADEWLSAELILTLQNLFNTQPQHAGYNINCCNYFMGQWLKHGEGYPDPHLRLFNRRYGNWQNQLIHEQVIVTGTIGKLKGDLLHESALSLEEYLTKQNRYTQIQAQLLWQRGCHTSFVQLMLHPLWRFVRLYLLRRGFLDGIPGLVHIVIGCFNSFMKYAKLWELEMRSKMNL